eukprot:2649800-Amphidinium_carterae.1
MTLVNCFRPFYSILCGRVLMPAEQERGSTDSVIGTDGRLQLLSPASSSSLHSFPCMRGTSEDYKQQVSRTSSELTGLA